MQSTQKQNNYGFIDSIRFIAMMSIVAEHCLSAGVYSSFPFGTELYWAYLVLMQFAKFGTVAFFLLSGFLLGDKFTDYSASEYFKRRLLKTIAPWLFWSLIYALIENYFLYLESNKYHNGEFNLQNILDNLKGLYLLSNYWFIINFMICIGLLLSFKRFLYSLYLGSLFFMFTLFYCVNIYFEWIEPNHTMAILGFVFFLWLGAQLRKYWHVIDPALKKVPQMAIIALLFVTFDLAIFEIINLHKLGIESTNTLRISNIIYSLVFFCLLLKIGTFKFIGFFKPRQTTYGIYLIHDILVVFLLPFLFKRVQVFKMTGIEFFEYRLMCFFTVYVITYLIVILIANSKAKKLVGL